jgi:hypothetical protein
MKKSTIALATLMISGASFAQVTVSGNLAMGYKSTTSGTGADASGLGVDTSEIVFTATEDLGGGQSVAAKMSLAGADRSGESGNGTVGGRDATLSYTNKSFGRIQFGSTQGVELMNGIPTAGAPVVDMDGKLFPTRTNSDYISYAVPVGPVTVQFKQEEAGSLVGYSLSKAVAAGTSQTGGQGLGVGGAGLDKQRKNQIAVSYVAGPVVVAGIYDSYDNRTTGGATAVAKATADAAGTKDTAYGLVGSYDFSVAKVGAGIATALASNGAKITNALIGVSVPAGAWTFGLTFAQATVADAPNTAAIGWDISKYNGTSNGRSVGVSYALSKRTSLTAKYGSWVRSGYSQYEAGPSSGLTFDKTSSESTILLSHTF